MSKVVTYYKTVIQFSNSVGHYLANNSLLDDLMNSKPPSPASYRVLVNSHEGSLDVLRDKISENWREIRRLWDVLRKLSELLGIYDPDDAKAFVILLQRVRKDSDFRERVRDWCHAELRKIAKTGNDPEQVISFGGFIERHEKLELQRQKKRDKDRALRRIPLDGSSKEN